jgi:PTS system ascorbate-specific IIA component
VKPGLLLITHYGIGQQLLRTALATFGDCPLQARVLEVNERSDPDALLEESRRLIDELDRGAGVLVLTDCFGSTPSNIATRLLVEGRVLVVSGVSLPMLIRVLNYGRLDLEDLARKAVSGGYEGIVLSSPE